MVMDKDPAFRKLIEREKEKITTELGDFVKFLAYTHDEGPDDVETEPARRGIRKLKGTPLWTALYPARAGYHAVKFVRQNGVAGVYQRAERAVSNNRFARRKEARKFLTKLMPTEEEKQKQRERTFAQDIKISVLVPLYNTPEAFLKDMVESVIGQTYQNWELCLADASDAAHGYVAQMIRGYAKSDSRIEYKRLEKNAGIAENTNACIRMASGDYLALFDHDDVLHPSALYECAKVIEREAAQFIYTDEVTFEGAELENIVTYHFKPDYSVDNLRGVNYICHLSVFQRELLETVGMFRPEYDGSQDHDLILRLTDAAEKVCHIPKALYFWRCHKQSTSMNLDAKSYAIAAGRRAVGDAELRRGYPAEVHSAQICKTHYRMKYQIGEPCVSILIYSEKKAKEEAVHTAAVLEKISAYSKYELFYAASFAELEEAISYAKGEYLLFLAAGITPITPSFIEELLMFAQRQDVGLVGMQTLDDKGVIVSSDLTVGDTADTLAIEVNRGGRYDAPGYMGRNYYAHNVSAISGYACMGRAKELALLWREGKAKAVYGRIFEICLRLRAQDRQIVLNPYALCKIGQAGEPDGLSASDRQMIMANYKEQILAQDPFYNPNLSLERPWQKK